MKYFCNVRVCGLGEGFFQKSFLAVQYVVSSRIYLLYYSLFSVSVKIAVVSTSDVVCTLGVELLAMVVVEMVVSSVVATLIEEYDIIDHYRMISTYVCKKFHLTNC